MGYALRKGVPGFEVNDLMIIQKRDNKSIKPGRSTKYKVEFNAESKVVAEWGNDAMP